MQIDKWLTKSDVAADFDELQRAKASANVGRLKKISSRIGRLKEEHVMKLQRSKIWRRAGDEVQKARSEGWISSILNDNSDTV
jgi:hypothetical protein